MRGGSGQTTNVSISCNYPPIFLVKVILIPDGCLFSVLSGDMLSVSIGTFPKKMESVMLKPHPPFCGSWRF